MPAAQSGTRTIHFVCGPNHTSNLRYDKATRRRRQISTPTVGRSDQSQLAVSEFPTWYVTWAGIVAGATGLCSLPTAMSRCDDEYSGLQVVRVMRSSPK